MDTIIEFGGDKYKVCTEDNGRNSIERFNEKYGMWVKIKFSDNTPGAEIERLITDILSRQCIENIVGTVNAFSLYKV